MKKLLVLALMTLSVAVFAADENTSSDSATGTTTTSVGGAVPAAAPVSVGESFMGAFGMGSSTPAGTSSSNSVGSVSSGMSSIGSNTVNNVTVTTPYSYK